MLWLLIGVDWTSNKFFYSEKWSTRKCFTIPIFKHVLVVLIPPSLSMKCDVDLMNLLFISSFLIIFQATWSLQWESLGSINTWSWTFIVSYQWWWLCLVWPWFRKVIIWIQKINLFIFFGQKLDFNFNSKSFIVSLYIIIQNGCPSHPLA